MKYLVLLLLVLGGASVHADIYRWVDRETGTVKFSHRPPPWYGDPEKARDAPAVEVIQYRAEPAKPPAAPKPAAGLAGLQARMNEIVKSFSVLPSTNEFERAGAAIQQQIEAYQALSAELDRLDPAGAARRREQDAPILERLRRGLEAQLGAGPRVQ